MSGTMLGSMPEVVQQAEMPSLTQIIPICVGDLFAKVVCPFPEVREEGGGHQGHVPPTLTDIGQCPQLWSGINVACTTKFLESFHHRPTGVRMHQIRFAVLCPCYWVSKPFDAEINVIDTFDSVQKYS